MNLFSERKRLEEQYKEWLKNNPQAADCAFSVITFLDLQDRLIDNADKKAFAKLAEYEEAEEKGLLHRTKVAIGQTVYTDFAMRGWYLRDAAKPYQAKVVFIGLNNSEEMGGGFFNVAYEKQGCMMQFRFSDIGKSVFLTKEEATFLSKQEGEA